MKQRKLNKSQKRLFNAIKDGYDWDWAYLLMLEKAKLQNMSEYFSTNQITRDSEYIVSRINLCIRLIDIIVDNGIHKSNPNVNIANIHRFIPSRHMGTSPEYLKEMLYVIKANNLYYELRKSHTTQWWN